MNTIQKILIAEDELTIRKPLAIQLKEEGYDVIEAEDGEKALEAALKEHPDLVLLDIVMPHMDGLEVLKALREDVWGKTARVIIFSNLNDMDKVATAAEYGVKEYLAKSDLRLDDIVSKIKAMLSSGHAS